MNTTNTRTKPTGTKVRKDHPTEPRPSIKKMRLDLLEKLNRIGDVDDFADAELIANAILSLDAALTYVEDKS